jgi:SAM-dependent methyltransferase
MVRIGAYRVAGRIRLDVDEIRQHWTQSARAHGTALQATTKTWTAKVLELDALTRRLTATVGDRTGRVLEMGCGNGVNCIDLAARFPNLSFDGVDYVPEMVQSATEHARTAEHADRLRFFVGDAVGVASVDGLAAEYDIVFTDRCLINLDTVDLQKAAISALAGKVRPGGHLVMIENCAATYDEQNRLRQALGLAPRTPASFNLFFDETEILPHIGSIGLELDDIEDFIGLHDLALYVLVPAVNGGEVDYDHPLVEAATLLNKAVSADRPSAFGPIGQNRLYFCRRPE